MNAQEAIQTYQNIEDKVHPKKRQDRSEIAALLTIAVALSGD